jgi:hypothetical protein
MGHGSGYGRVELWMTNWEILILLQAVFALSSPKGFSTSTSILIRHQSQFTVYIMSVMCKFYAAPCLPPLVLASPLYTLRLPSIFSTPSKAQGPPSRVRQCDRPLWGAAQSQSWDPRSRKIYSIISAQKTHPEVDSLQTVPNNLDESPTSQPTQAGLSETSIVPQILIRSEMHYWDANWRAKQPSRRLA